MPLIETIPNADDMATLERITPAYMAPTSAPYAVVLPGYLSNEQCDRILEVAAPIRPHSFPGCRAETREFSRPLDAAFEPVLEVLLLINSGFFGFDLYEDEPGAYMQTYVPGDEYRWHVDGAPGQTRKLTAVSMLSDPSDYEGGDLVIKVSQREEVASNARGTVVIFPAWVNHHVRPITSGIRRTGNLGLWGPPFK